MRCYDQVASQYDNQDDTKLDRCDFCKTRVATNYFYLDGDYYCVDCAGDEVAKVLKEIIDVYENTDSFPFLDEKQNKIIAFYLVNSKLLHYDYKQ